MRRNLIIVGVVGIAVFGIFLIVVAVGRSAAPAITIRHVKSIQSGETTRLIFEISNHTASSYVFFPLTVDVRRGTVWAPSYKFSKMPPIGSLIGTLGPSSFISYQPEVMSLPKGVPLRLRISANKNLTGLEGFVGRVQLSILFYRAGGRPFSLYPFGNKSGGFGPPIEVVSEEFEESPKNPAER